MKASVLIIEDDLDLQELLVECLQDHGYAAQGVSSADDAVRAAASTHFDLVVSDVRLAGGRDGLWALETLKKREPQLRCLVITGYAENSAPLRAMKLQVDDYLYKPFNEQALCDTVGKVLGARQERSGYGQLLATLLSLPRKLIESQARKAALAALATLDQERDQFWQAFFVAVRSKALSRGAFLELFDKLENGEAQYEKLLQAQTETPPEAWRKLAEGYGALHQQVTRLSETHSAGWARPRPPTAIPMNLIFTLFERLTQGLVTVEQFRLSVVLARLSADKLQGEAAVLRSLLFAR